MSEENKQPLPEDVPQTPPASPAQPEESIAALEREARAKREAELNEQQEDKEANPVQPAVNKLKKRKRGKATAFLAIVAVALIFAAWGGNWVYRNLIWQPKEEKKAADSGQTNKTDYRQRTDLGQDNDTGQAAPQEGGSTGSGTTGGQLSPPVPAGLDKAQFLVRREGSASSESQVKTRREEMTMKASQTAVQKDDSSPSAAADKAGTPALKQAEPVRRIPYNPDLYVPENTAIPCSLDYRFVSDRAGKIRCTITKDIWSASGNTKLIEKGTGATGLYQTGAEDGMKHGQGRAFIIITKLRTRQAPFLDIPLIDTNAAGELGEAGVDGWIDSHFGERFGGALMVGMIPDIGAWASNSAGKKDRNTDYTENSRQAMAEMAKTTLENSINIPPTLYKNQGEIINLITGQDIDFSNIYTLKMKGNTQ
ncbi:TrbI/VirB10 family protein [Salmonella enterica]|nr:TrbI/VirB10 family protein [Salmonella enterica]EHV2061158.1 TrbI/VirB10 family protein [Salmonella enterica]